MISVLNLILIDINLDMMGATVVFFGGENENLIS